MDIFFIDADFFRSSLVPIICILKLLVDEPYNSFWDLFLSISELWRIINIFTSKCLFIFYLSLAWVYWECSARVLGILFLPFESLFAGILRSILSEEFKIKWSMSSWQHLKFEFRYKCFILLWWLYLCFSLILKILQWYTRMADLFYPTNKITSKQQTNILSNEAILKNNLQCFEEIPTPHCDISLETARYIIWFNKLCFSVIQNSSLHGAASNVIDSLHSFVLDF